MASQRVAIGRNGETFEGLGSLSTVNNLITLRNLQLALRPTRTLEIGLAFGGSCLVFTATHRDLGFAPTRQHVALDPWQAEVWGEVALMAAERAGLREYLDFRGAFAFSELPSMVSRGERFQLVYEDGSHLFEDVFVNFYYISRMLDDGGVIAFDDSANPHVAKVHRYIRRNLKDVFKEFDLRPFRAEFGRSLRYRCATASALS